MNPAGVNPAYVASLRPFDQSGAFNLRLPSVDNATPGSDSPCLSHNWQVTCLCF